MIAFARAIVVLASLLISSELLAATPTELYNSGNSAYKNGDYKGAYDFYLQAISTGIMNPDLFYNLGNASFKSGKSGEAILYYEKGLRLNPRDKKIKENLEFVKLKLKDKIETPPKGAVTLFLNWSYSQLSLNGFFTFALICYLLFFFSLIALGKLLKSIRVYAASFSFFLLLISSSFLGAKIYNEKFLRHGVAIVPEIEAKSEPSKTGEIVFTIHDGMTFEIREQRAEWMLITLPTGWSGWVLKEQIGIM
jgi:tetratricopeptide (TPR) repeat protein